MTDEVFAAIQRIRALPSPPADAGEREALASTCAGTIKGKSAYRR